RDYRLVARVDATRGTPIGGPVSYGDLNVQGGLSYADPTPCTGGEEVTASIDPSTIYASFRFAAVSFAAGPFVRGDCNGDAAVNVADAVFFLLSAFAGGESPECDDACDANDDGLLDVADAVYALEALFIGGPDIAGPETCGVDPTVDALECVRSGSCP
ncbi:MAG: hypothetical protein KDC38_15655, partial [Planctomycetes bacterium]|nr:hypothetical protein [Planctomycetota bacterium]